MNKSNLKQNFVKKCKGFTLTELLATILITGIISLTAAPSLSDLHAKERRVAAINQLMGAIRYTRSLAIQYHKVATFCPSADKIHCNRNWSLPFIIFVDVNNDRIRQDDEPLLKLLPKINAQDKLRWKAFRNSNSLQFSPSGITNHQNGTFLYCPKFDRTDLARGIIITKMGRARLSEDRNHDGIQEGAGGKKLTCS